MTGRGSRFLGFGLLASAGAGLLALTSVMNPAFALGDDTAWIMGGTGIEIPNPSPGYVKEAYDLYLASQYPGYTPEGLVTPEQLYPLTGAKSLPLDTSVAQGVQILNDTIAPNGVLTTSPTVVFGYSQSTLIASLEMEKLDPSSTPYPDSPLSFAMIGDVMNPNGGFFERFAGLSLPSIGVTLYGATPANDFPTTIYTLEYDGAADFPRYPIDLPADLNAVAGFVYVHPTYPVLPSSEIASATLLPGSQALGADSLTNYYMIPTGDLPLLNPVRDIPLIGNPIADLLRPDLTYIVNLGYGDPLFGWSTTPANVATPFGLFPPLRAFEQLPGLLASGTAQGIQNFIGDLTGTGPNPVTLSLGSLTSLLDQSSGTTSVLADPYSALSGFASDPASSLSDIVNTLTGVISTDLSVIQPTADLALAVGVSAPVYDAQLFVNSLEAGNLLDALALPIAADLGLAPFAGLVELDVVANAAITTIHALMGLLP